MQIGTASTSTHPSAARTQLCSDPANQTNSCMFLFLLATVQRTMAVLLSQNKQHICELTIYKIMID